MLREISVLGNDEYCLGWGLFPLHLHNPFEVHSQKIVVPPIAHAVIVMVFQTNSQPPQLREFPD